MIGIVMAFQRIKPNTFIFNADWVGLANFRYLFSLPTTMQVIWNTLVIAFFKIVTIRIAAISLSILLNEVKSPYISEQCRLSYICRISCHGLS